MSGTRFGRGAEVGPVPRTGVTSAAGGLGTSLVAAAGPFVLSRAIVIGALLLARFVVSNVASAGRTAVSASHAGLLGWDAAWYQQITAHGYAVAGRQAVRFFPLLPLVARVLSRLPGVDAGAALLVVSNVAAFTAFALVHRLAVLETGDDRTATAAAWWLALLPASFVLVMGYAESLLLVVSISAFLGLRSGRFAWAAAAGLLAGACRPVGVLIAVPAAVEVVRDLRRSRRPTVPGLLSRAAAVLAPPAGAVAYLAWQSGITHSFLLPITEQESSQHRGGLTDPITTLVHDVRDLVRGSHLGTALHAPWVLVFVALAVVLLLRWPFSYGAYAVATLAVALTAHNLDSLERYGLGCFPFALALAGLTRRQQVERGLLAAAGALLAAYAVLAFLGLYVP